MGPAAAPSAGPGRAGERRPDKARYWRKKGRRLGAVAGSLCLSRVWARGARVLPLEWFHLRLWDLTVEQPGSSFFFFFFREQKIGGRGGGGGGSWEAVLGGGAEAGSARRDLDRPRGAGLLRFPAAPR